MDSTTGISSVLENLPAIRRTIAQRKPVFFLDFDAALAPRAPRPELTRMAPEMKRALQALSQHYAVCVLSGRDLADLVRKVGMHTLYYAADHGFRVVGPKGTGIDFEVASEAKGNLEAASYAIEQRLRDIPGVVAETKGVSLAVHYSHVGEADRPLVEQVVNEVAAATPGFRLRSGGSVHELVPDAGWDEGKAALWILRRLRLDRKDSCPVCLGDDLADEAVFHVAQGWGLNVTVGYTGGETMADYSLHDWVEVAAFLGAFVPEIEPLTSGA